MYTFLINEDNTVVTTEKQIIVQRSSLVDTLQILCNARYGEFNMLDFTLIMQYILPASNEHMLLELVPKKELYKDSYIVYNLPVDAGITRFVGDVRIQFTFLKQDNDTGESYVRKTTEATLPITPLSEWCQNHNNTNLIELDNKILQILSSVQALDKVAQDIYIKKADGVALDEQGLSATANGEKIGKVVSVKQLEQAISEEALSSDDTHLVTFIEI